MVTDIELILCPAQEVQFYAGLINWILDCRTVLWICC